MLKAVLPFPISVNAMYIPLGRGRRRKILTSAARAYKTQCVLLLKQQLTAPIVNDEQALALLLVLHPARYNCDADNHLKIVQDTLKIAGMVKDDRIITPTTAVIGMKSKQPFCELFLAPIPLNREAMANNVIQSFQTLVDISS